MLHESRADWAQLLTSSFLLAAGPGRWSLDALRARARGRTRTAARTTPAAGDEQHVPAPV
ncbi:MAG TPA: hypothetical protein VGQ83_30950 [Polyangia bacterium]